MLGRNVARSSDDLAHDTGRALRSSAAMLTTLPQHATVSKVELQTASGWLVGWLADCGGSTDILRRGGEC